MSDRDNTKVENIDPEMEGVEELSDEALEDVAGGWTDPGNNGGDGGG